MVKKKYNYLYKTTNLINNKYYYGIHSTNNLNDNYLGSGKHLINSIKKYGKENFKREILHYFDNREELIYAEQQLITEKIILDKMCMNMTPGGEIWNSLNMVAVKDKNNNYFKVLKNDPRYLSGELVGVTKGMITVKDENNNIFKISKDDPRYLNSELKLKKHLNWKGKKHTDETKKKMSESSKGMCTGSKNGSYGTCWITKNNKNKKIKKEELQSFINNGWIKGRKVQ